MCTHKHQDDRPQPLQGLGHLSEADLQSSDEGDAGKEKGPLSLVSGDTGTQGQAYHHPDRSDDGHRLVTECIEGAQLHLG